MLKYTSIALIAGSCITASVSADINWGQFVDPTGARNHKALEFTSSGSGSQYTTFSNVNGSGLDMRMTVTGTGFAGAAISTLHYGYSAPAYNYGQQLGTGAPNLGLVFESAFAEKGQTYTVTFTFYNGSEQVAIDGTNFTIYGIGTSQPQPNWQPSWGLQPYRDVVSNINASYDGTTIYGLKDSLIPAGSDPSDYVSVSAGNGINNPNAGSSQGINPNEYGFQQGIYYGTTQDWASNDSNQGNLSVVYNAPTDSISFTFGNSGDQNVAQKTNQKQYFGIGGFDFGEQYVVDPGTNPNIPEPSTYALMITMGVAAVAIIRRRKA